MKTTIKAICAFALVLSFILLIVSLRSSDVDFQDSLKQLLEQNIDQSIEEKSGQPIAQWSTVPFQTFTESLNIGVLAFHHSGIERVDFIYKNGSVKSVREMTYNPMSRMQEYNIPLLASSFLDSGVEFKAKVYPINGEPKILTKSLVVFPNSKATLKSKIVYVSPLGSDQASGAKSAPLKTIAAAVKNVGSGGKIFLAQGTYGDSLTARSSKVIPNWRWIRVCAAPDAPADSVLIKPSSRSVVFMPATKMKFENIHFDFSNIIQIYPEQKDNVWFERCRWFDSGGNLAVYKKSMVPVRISPNISGSYATDCIAEDMLYGFVQMSFVRGCIIKNITGDAFQNSQLVANCYLDGLDGSLSPHHSDVLQYFGKHNNVIVYNVVAKNVREAQNIFFDHSKSSFSNMAFVNIAIENLSGKTVHSQLFSEQNHILFYHISNPGQKWIFREDQKGTKSYSAKDVVFRNCVFEQLLRNPNVPGIPSGTQVQNNHFCDIPPEASQESTFGQISLVINTSQNIEHVGSSSSLLQNTGKMLNELKTVYELKDDLSKPDRGAFGLLHK